MNITWKRLRRIAFWYIVIGVPIALLITYAHGSVQNIVICPTHGVQAAWTGTRKTVFGKDNKRQDYCQYSHPLKDLSGVDKFWQECNE